MNQNPETQPVDANALALQRTHFAEERTMMAWTRTSVSLIGFGFTIYNFFRYLWERGDGLVNRPQAPRNLALALIGLGTLSLIAAAIQHWMVIKDLRSMGAPPRLSFSLIVAILMSIVGIFAFVSVYERGGLF